MSSIGIANKFATVILFLFIFANHSVIAEKDAKNISDFCITHYYSNTYDKAIASGYSEGYSKKTSACMANRLMTDFKRINCKCLVYEDTDKCEIASSKSYGLSRMEYRLAVSYHCNVLVRENK